MKEIIVGDRVCIVDDEDLPWASLCPITVKKVQTNYYAFIDAAPLHQLVLKVHGVVLEKGKVVDHRNRNSLDNRFINLRQIESWENLCLNRAKRRGTSRYIGVSKLPNGMWRSQYSHIGENIYLGMYDTEMRAAVMHDIFAISNYRNPMRLNFPGETDLLRGMFKR